MAKVSPRWIASSFLVLILALVSSAPADAQQPPAGQIVDVDDSNFPEVRVILSVADASNQAVTGLQPQAFSASEAGMKAGVQDVQTVVDKSVGVAVTLVIDTSGSMQGASIEQARAAAQAFVRALAPVDLAAVVTFASKVTVTTPLTADRAATLKALTDIQAAGDTALYSGVNEAVNQARTAALPRKAIVLLSDGEDFGGASTATREQTLALASQARIPIYVVGVGALVDKPYLEELAQRSGGGFFAAPTASQIPDIYDRLSRLLRGQYVLTLKSAAAPDLGQRAVDITVTTPGGPLKLHADYASRRPATAAAATNVGAAADSDGSSWPLIAFITALAAAALVFAATTVWRQRSQRQIGGVMAIESARAADLLRESTPRALSSTERPTAAFVLEGPQGVVTFDLGDEPLSLGYGDDCDIRFGSPREHVAEQHARIWLREGKVMFHHLASDATSLLGGQRVNWVALDEGDEVTMGTYSLRAQSQRSRLARP